MWQNRLKNYLRADRTTQTKEKLLLLYLNVMNVRGGGTDQHAPAALLVADTARHAAAAPLAPAAQLAVAARRPTDRCKAIPS